MLIWDRPDDTSYDLTEKIWGEIDFILRVAFIPTYLSLIFKRLQFPVGLTFSIMINKTQGQSIKYCGAEFRS